MCSLTSSRCLCTHCFENSFKRKHPFGSTMKCTQCYGAMRPSVAPCALRAQDAVHVLAMEPSGRPWLHGFSMLQTLYPLFSDLLKREKPCGSTINCIKSTQCHAAIKPSVAPGALHPQCAVRIVLKCIQNRAPLWVDHKLHAML